MEEYITDEQFQTVIEDLKYKLDNNQIEEMISMLQQMLKDAETNEKYIDRTYIGDLKAKKRKTKIEAIVAMLEKMTDEQLENVRAYTTDEYDEPNHEAEALEAIVRLSRKFENKTESEQEASGE